jgi:nicotinamidase-related amidase
MKKSIFLVMDMMNDLVDENGFNAKTYGVQVTERNMLAHTASAIAAARAAQVPVGFVRVGFSDDYRECPPRLADIFRRAQERHLQTGYMGYASPSQPCAAAAGF